MKQLFIAFIALIHINLMASPALVMIEAVHTSDIHHYLNKTGIQVNYYHHPIIIATVDNVTLAEGIILDPNPWQPGWNYLISYTGAPNSEYRLAMQLVGEVLYESGTYLVLKVSDDHINHLYPLTHNGLDAIFPITYTLPSQRFVFDPSTVSYNPVIAGYVEEVNVFELMPKMQHLQNYGTRNCFTPQAIVAQNWIKQKFESYGLSVVLHDFPIGSQNPSDNVIATQPGVIYPDEYIIVGGHYDSFVFSGNMAPGADDNASGTSGVLEIARILSQYQFERSIIYCAFSGEEYGLYGSAAWVSWAKANNLNILGYVNMDMIGYVAPGNGIHTHIIAPASAQPLVDYYTAVANTYVPNMGVYMGTLTGGNSDHSSFNSQGYMGIFPFEDSQNYSPYIHTANDIMGLSVNNSELAIGLTRAALATMASVAQPFNGYYPPMNLIAIQNGNIVTLSWSPPLNTNDFSEYKVYRNNEHIATLNGVMSTTFDDTGLTVGGYYLYYVTAVYGGPQPGESNPSNSVGISFGLVTIYEWDFEDSPQGWTILNTNTGWKWGLTVPLTGNNTKYLGINSDAYGQSVNVKDYAISPVLNLTNYYDVKLVFDYGYRKYTSDFLKVVYRTNPGAIWTELANLNPSTSFKTHSILLPQQAITNSTQVAFYYNDNNTWAWYAGVDNVKIRGYDLNLTGIGYVTNGNQVSLKTIPNPASKSFEISVYFPDKTAASIEIHDSRGIPVMVFDKFDAMPGYYSFTRELNNIPSGIYYLVLQTDTFRSTTKLIVLK